MIYDIAPEDLAGGTPIIVGTSTEIICNAKQREQKKDKSHLKKSNVKKSGDWDKPLLYVGGISASIPEKGLVTDTLENGNLSSENIRAETGDIPNESAEGFEDSADMDNYKDYKPRNLHLGNSHPDILIESTSLSACQLPPLTYQLHLPAEVARQSKLSCPQLEAISYAAQAHSSMLANGERR